MAYHLLISQFFMLSRLPRQSLQLLKILVKMWSSIGRLQKTTDPPSKVTYFKFFRVMELTTLRLIVTIQKNFSARFLYHN